MQIVLLHETKPAHVPLDAPPDIYMELETVDDIERIADALEDLGHTVTLVNSMLDPITHLVRIAFDGMSYPKHDTLVFNYAVGFGTRSREILPAAMCELAGIAYTGSDPMTLAHASDKSVAKDCATRININTPWSRLVRNVGGIVELWPEVTFETLLKPNYEGSSIGICGPFGADQKKDVLEAAIDLFNTYEQPLMLEQFIPGYEVTVPVLGTKECIANPLLLRLDGEAFLDRRIYDSSRKASHNSYDWIAGAPGLQSALTKAGEWAIQIHKELGCRDFSRSDFRVSASGEEVYFLEINPTPQITGSFCVGQDALGRRALKEVLADIIASAKQRFTPSTKAR